MTEATTSTTTHGVGSVSALAVDYIEGRNDTWGEVHLIFANSSDRQQAFKLATQTLKDLKLLGYRVNSTVLEERGSESFTLKVRFVCGFYVFSTDPRRDQLSSQLQQQMVGAMHFLHGTMIQSIRTLIGAQHAYTATATATPLYDEDGEIINHRLVISRTMNPDRKGITIDIGVLSEVDWKRRYERLNLTLIFEPSNANGMEPVITEEQVYAMVRDITGQLDAHLIGNVIFAHSIAL